MGEKTQHNFFYRFAATKNKPQTRLYARQDDQITLVLYREKAHIATWMNDSIDHTLTLIYSDSDKRRDTTLADLTTLQYIILFFFGLTNTIRISFEAAQSSTLPLSEKGILLARSSSACLHFEYIMRSFVLFAQSQPLAGWDFSEPSLPRLDEIIICLFSQS